MATESPKCVLGFMMLHHQSTDGRRHMSNRVGGNHAPVWGGVGVLLKDLLVLPEYQTIIDLVRSEMFCL